MCGCVVVQHERTTATKRNGKKKKQVEPTSWLRDCSSIVRRVRPISSLLVTRYYVVGPDDVCLCDDIRRPRRRDTFVVHIDEKTEGPHKFTRLRFRKLRTAKKDG